MYAVDEEDPLKIEADLEVAELKPEPVFTPLDTRPKATDHDYDGIMVDEIDSELPHMIKVEGGLEGGSAKRQVVPVVLLKVADGHRLGILTPTSPEGEPRLTGLHSTSLERITSTTTTTTTTKTMTATTTISVDTTKKNNNQTSRRHETTLERTCPDCGKVFTKSGKMMIHRRTVHEGRKDFSCGICKKAFATQQGLKSHKLSLHHKIVDQECENCHKRFHSAKLLRIHVNRIHLGIREACDQCSKTFYSKDSLRQHKALNHENRRDYTCHLCGKSFAARSVLNGHLKSKLHGGVNQHECEVCHKKFPIKSVLRRHVRVAHEGLKDYLCYLCAKRFSSQSTLGRHLKEIHERLREYVCQNCRKTFRRKSELKEHNCKITGKGKGNNERRKAVSNRKKKITVQLTSMEPVPMEEEVVPKQQTMVCPFRVVSLLHRNKAKWLNKYPDF